MPITAAQAAALEPHWLLTSYHEAGHAVATVLLDLPVHEVYLRYERRFLRWAVVGRTLITPPGRTIEVDDTPNLLFTTAGVAAEAIWLMCRDGCSYGRAWAAAEDNPVNQAGDMREIAACSRDATFTYAEAQAWAHEELAAAWDNVTAIAEQLRDTGTITSRQLAHLV
jgi:hypothetical protein